MLELLFLLRNLIIYTHEPTHLYTHPHLEWLMVRIISFATRRYKKNNFNDHYLNYEIKKNEIPKEILLNIPIP